ncbi:NCS1 nucleoside transporter family [Macrolepiota fuliginosa MF-IS2]|uniref:NCS1 nucleoside transporter family n=1 Tax=Macrolepiota fuliginosa MF-IS2 TaxID=1400762 RepID=A0A9P6C2I3_9AGAR|nr:NCS1 nucleoside transporter family [Macrolepiota fuliginosa MF-IS2]
MKNYFRLSTWSLEPENSQFGPNSRWSNKDMDPVPVQKRTWSTWNYIAYWVSDATNVATWQLASSMLAVGLSWKQALPAIALGHTIIAFVVVLNGTIGARLHIAFPVINRASFGFWLSYFTVISRIVLAMFWFGILTFTGSECIYQMLKAIWPSTVRIPNHLSQDGNVTSVGIMCYFLYWLIQFPFMLVSPQKIRHLFTAKSIIVPIAWLAILIWSFVKVPARISLDSRHSQLSGASLSWAWLGALNSALGFYATLSVNIPDFTRYAKNERVQYIQLAIIPTLFTLAAFIGIAVTSAAEIIYGEVLWDPLRLIDKWDNRAAAFFASFSFMLATLGTNLSANSLSAANDMTVLLPQYINIRRGQAICAIIGGWVLCPWEILASAPKFLSFMSGYTVFLGPFAAIMIIDFWFIHKCRYDVPAMYDPHGRYQYWNGINWRALVALIVSVAPNLPGLIHNINPGIPVGNASFMFNISWLFGFFVSGSVFWILSVACPPRETLIDRTIYGDDVTRELPWDGEVSGKSKELDYVKA